MKEFGQVLYRFWDTKVHFIHLHYTYILLLIFIFSGLYYCESDTNWNYIDALFMATTGSTDTGLNTIAMSDMSTYHMVLLYLSSFLGSHVTVSFAVVMVRKYYFSKRFQAELKENKRRKEEYKRKKQMAAAEEEQQRTSSDTVSTTNNSFLSKGVAGPIRRRMSTLSLCSLPPTSSKRFSLFSTNKKRKSSIDTHTAKMDNIVVHHNHNHLDYPNNISDLSEDNSSNNIDQNKDFSSIQMEERRKEDDTNNVTTDTLDTLNTAAPTILNSPNVNDNQQQNSDCKNTSTMTDDTDSIHFTDDNSNSTATASSNNNNNSHITSNTSNQPNQQITFREDTNILRERERRKLEQNRHQNNDEEQQYSQVPLHRTNSEYEIMSRPENKSELTKNERYRIGGTEYRALDMLALIVPLYYLGFIIFFGFFFRIYVACSTYAQTVLATSNNNQPVDPWFFSFFMSLSAFTNLGLNHLDDSMIPFQNAPTPLILSIILILVGNTAFAILLRFIIWLCYVLTPESYVMRRETFRYLLDHPRRCFTTLFPATQTWWLLFVLVGITIVELVCFLLLNYWLPVLAGISWGSRFLDGLFQSVATRNAGFSVVSLADINPGAQLVYIVAMYISVYPVAISMRNSNVYQERALGIFRGENEEPIEFTELELSETPFIELKRHSTMTSIAQGTKKLIRGPDFFVITQIQKQLTSDICWVITGIFCICCLEAESIMSPSPITIATVIYECVSAFGNVGASTGYPNTPTSQAAQYRVVSKLVLIILMYRGRHRGLPASIDRSILLPSDALAEKEKEDRERKRSASVSVIQHIGNNSNTSDNSHATSSGTDTGPNHVIHTRSCTL